MSLVLKLFLLMEPVQKALEVWTWKKSPSIKARTSQSDENLDCAHFWVQNRENQSNVSMALQCFQYGVKNASCIKVFVISKLLNKFIFNPSACTSQLSTFESVNSFKLIYQNFVKLFMFWVLTLDRNVIWRWKITAFESHIKLKHENDIIGNSFFLNNKVFLTVPRNFRKVQISLSRLKTENREV